MGLQDHQEEASGGLVGVVDPQCLDIALGAAVGPDQLLQERLVGDVGGLQELQGERAVGARDPVGVLALVFEREVGVEEQLEG